MNDQTRLHREKIAQARRYMAERGIDAWLIRDRGTGDPCVPLMFGIQTVGDAVYLITGGAATALVESRDADAVNDSALFDQVIVVGEETGADSERAARLRTLLGAIAPTQIAVNVSAANHLADGMTVGTYRSLLTMLGPELSGRLVPSDEFLQRLRSIKTAEEVAYIRKAIAITLEIYDEVFAAIRVGMTEIEVGELFIEGMRKRGVVNGITRSLTPPIVMKHKIAHRAPGPGVIEKGDYLIMDFSVDYCGYCSDIARTAYVLRDGETGPSDAMEAAFRTVREATDRALEVLKPGAIGRDVDHAARQYVLDHGYPNIFHSVGHQVGRDVHDGGTMLGPDRGGYRKDSLGTVEAGMVFAVEPTILYEEGPAIISEDNYLVTDDGAELLGEPQRNLVLI